MSNTVIASLALGRPSNQTFAHEVGHFLGMADWRFPGREIMCEPNDAFRLDS